MTRIDIINTLIEKKGYKSYLEIGVQHGICFNKIKCLEKTGVDPDLTTKQYVPDIVTLTSDDFFKVTSQKFDIIFIDGLHHYEQVYQDITNSLNHLNEGGTIVCHDMLPPDEAHQIVPREQLQWTGDCWKAWVILRGTRSDLKMYVIDTDYGVGIISKGYQQTITFKKLDYKAFLENKMNWMNIKYNLEF